jgi:hypothetical protein
MKKKVGANRVIFSYRPSYAAYGPFLTYDLPTGRLTRYRCEDPFVTTGSFLEDTDFLDAAFALSRRTGMTLDRAGWEQVMALLAGHPGLNPFLRSDWTFSASLALGRLEEVQRHLKALARIARLIKSTAFIEKIVSSTSVQDMVRAFDEEEVKIC